MPCPVLSCLTQRPILCVVWSGQVRYPRFPPCLLPRSWKFNQYIYGLGLGIPTFYLGKVGTQVKVPYYLGGVGGVVLGLFNQPAIQPIGPPRTLGSLIIHLIIHLPPITTFYTYMYATVTANFTHTHTRRLVLYVYVCFCHYSLSVYTQAIYTPFFPFYSGRNPRYI